MKEIWKDIAGFEGHYQVSNLGRVRGLERSIKYSTGKIAVHKSKIFKGQYIYGYYYVHLCKNNKVKAFRVHRLVASAFIENPNNYEYVNHKDENKANNKSENLEWCTAKYNINYGTNKDRSSKKKEKPVVQIDINTNLPITEFSSGIMAANALKLVASHIYGCCNGKRETHGGYKWIRKIDTI